MRKKKDILTKYAYYRPYLTLIGRIELNKSVIIEDVGLSRGVIQAGYKEMEEDKFTGSIIHYLCYISQEYLIETAKKKTKDALEIAKLIVTDYPLYKEDTLNLLRLFHINPEILIDSVMLLHHCNDKEFNEYRRKIFLLLSHTWYHLFSFTIYNQDDELHELIFDEDYMDEGELKIHNNLMKLIES